MEIIDNNFDWNAPLQDKPSTLYPWKEIYPTLERKPIRLSYSTNSLLESCARKFQLTKDKKLTEWDIPRDTRENNQHLDFGSAIGIGTAQYIITNNLKSAIWAALKDFKFGEETEVKNSISLVTCLQALAKSWNPDQWEVAIYNNKPAAELSFKIILDENTQDYYCGYVDLILIHKESKLAVVVEVKSTGSRLENIHPFYQNSSQGLGYSTILDSITGGSASWQVLYLVYQFKFNHIIPKLHLFPYMKTIQDRLEWLIDLRFIYERILAYYDIGYWPKRGTGCMFFNKPCPFFGMCDIEALQMEQEAWITKEANWDFVFHINELIERST